MQPYLLCTHKYHIMQSNLLVMERWKMANASYKTFAPVLRYETKTLKSAQNLCSCPFHSWFSISSKMHLHLAVPNTTSIFKHIWFSCSQRTGHACGQGMEIVEKHHQCPGSRLQMLQYKCIVTVVSTSSVKYTQKDSWQQ